MAHVTIDQETRHRVRPVAVAAASGAEDLREELDVLRLTLDGLTNLLAGGPTQPDDEVAQYLVRIYAAMAALEHHVVDLEVAVKYDRGEVRP